MKIKEERHEKTFVEYRLNYFVDETGGYSFPCDENGKVNDDLHPVALKNLKFCQQNPDKFKNPGQVEKITHTYMEPAIGICDICGAEVRLENEYMSACQCKKCGQWYNLWGQQLLPPDRWEDDEY